MSKLKPCPFCGDTDVCIEANDDYAGYWIGCNSPDCYGMTVYGDEQEIIDWWNTRPIEARYRRRSFTLLKQVRRLRADLNAMLAPPDENDPDVATVLSLAIKIDELRQENAWLRKTSHEIAEGGTRKAYEWLQTAQKVLDEVTQDRDQWQKDYAEAKQFYAEREEALLKGITTLRAERDQARDLYNKAQQSMFDVYKTYFADYSFVGLPSAIYTLKDEYTLQKERADNAEQERDQLKEENALLKEVLTGIRQTIVILYEATAPLDGDQVEQQESSHD